MKPYTILLYATLLLSLAIPSHAFIWARPEPVWPSGMNLVTFKAELSNKDVVRTGTWQTAADLGATGERYWYEEKLFFIETESDSYAGAIITEIITVSSNNVLIVFYHNGFVIYLPFNRITKMYEVKK